MSLASVPPVDDPTPADELAIQRNRRDDTPSPVDWNATLEVLVSHRSVRAFRPDHLPAGALETWVTAAQSAAASSNPQVWSLVAVEDAERKARLAAPGFELR